MIITNPFLLYIFVVNSSKKFGFKGWWLLVNYMSVYFIEKNVAFYLVFDHVDLYFFLIYTLGRTRTERSNLEMIGRASKKKKLLDQTVAVRTQPVQIFPISIYTTWRWLTNSFSGGCCFNMFPLFLVLLPAITYNGITSFAVAKLSQTRIRVRESEIVPAFSGQKKKRGGQNFPFFYYNIYILCIIWRTQKPTRRR